MGAALNSAKFELTIFFRIVNQCMALKHRNNRYKMVLHSYCINACVVGGTRTFNFVKKSMAHFPHHVAQFTPLAARFPHWPVLPHHTLYGSSVCYRIPPVRVQLFWRGNLLRPKIIV